MLQAIKNISCSGITSALPVVETNQCSIEETLDDETEEEKNFVETLYINVDLAFETVDVEKASFGMSSFWFPEAQFGTVEGVIRTCVGYSGGDSKSPTYKSLGGHTETVLVEYDPKVITYENILDIFWKNHDPVIRSSRQLMSVIFYHSPDQKQLAEESLKKESAQKNLRTKIFPAQEFFYAEDHHQKYLLQRHPYILGLMDMKPGPSLIKSHVATRLNGYASGFGVIESFQKDVDNLCLSPKVGMYIRNLLSKKTNKKIES